MGNKLAIFPENEGPADPPLKKPRDYSQNQAK